MNDEDRKALYESQLNMEFACAASQIVIQRIIKGLSIEELASKSGVSARLIRSMERGRFLRVNLTHLALLAKVFDVAVAVRLAPFSEAIRSRLASTEPVPDFAAENKP